MRQNTNVSYQRNGAIFLAVAAVLAYLFAWASDLNVSLHCTLIRGNHQ